VSDVASREGGNPYHGLIYFFSTIFLLALCCGKISKMGQSLTTNQS
jgi:hypothetical protein